LASDAQLVIVNTPVGTHFEYAKKVLLARNAVSKKAFYRWLKQRNWLPWPRKKKLKLSVFKTEDGTVILKQCARFF
jgi:hypothetical protein